MYDMYHTDMKQQLRHRLDLLKANSGKTVAVSIRLPEGLNSKIEAIAKRMGLTKTEVIVEALKDSFQDNLKSK